jgi:hypothetical protein
VHEAAFRSVLYHGQVGTPQLDRREAERCRNAREAGSGSRQRFARATPVESLPVGFAQDGTNGVRPHHLAIDERQVPSERRRKRSQQPIGVSQVAQCRADRVAGVLVRLARGREVLVADAVAACPVGKIGERQSAVALGTRRRVCSQLTHRGQRLRTNAAYELLRDGRAMPREHDLERLAAPGSVPSPSARCEQQRERGPVRAVGEDAPVTRYGDPQVPAQCRRGP